MKTKSVSTKKDSAKKTTKAPVKSTAKTPAKKDAAKNLNDLFEDALKDIYWAEKALTKALPKMQKNATDLKLKKAIGNHLEETKEQVKRLEACFKALKKKPQAKKNAMQCKDF